MRRETARVRSYLRAVGYAESGLRSYGLYSALVRLFTITDEPRLEALTVELLEEVHREAPSGSSLRRATFRLAHALHGMGVLPRCIRHRRYAGNALDGVPPTWAAWCQRWNATSTLAPKSREGIYHGVLKAGRWLAREHPTVYSPADWTREVALAYVPAVDRFTVGELSAPHPVYVARKGTPISANYKERLLGAVRTFFSDAQEWGWCSRRFDPQRTFATPRAVKALIGPRPRIIADEIWAKLLWAGLNLSAADLPADRWYPLPLVKALTVTWLFAGLRSDEIVRLRVGCIRWQHHDGGPGAGREHIPGDGATCLLDVPVNKTGAGHTKPLDPVVGEAIAAWEALRPTQPLLADRKTGERVAILYSFRGRRVPPRYLNLTLIPALCRKAGVPLVDARGRITSHRARSTIASQLYNAKDPMTLFELQAWLGHRSPESTQHYARISPSTLTKAYADAGYFARNLRTIEVLVDREAVQNGAATGGAPWQYFDLGHGYCTFSFFEQCPHRMACARCDFYVPKDSTKAQLLEGRGNLQRMLATIPLTEDERAAVDDGSAALDRLLERLADVPTPSGPTPRELAPRLAVNLPIVQRQPPQGA